MNICPDISNPEVKREFDNLKLFTKNPYQLWDLNGGYELSKAPNGKNSKFYESLAYRYGDPVKALKQKAYYLTNKDSLNFPLDENGDPLYSSWYARLVNTIPETTKVISDVLPLKGNEELYKKHNLLNDKGEIKALPKNSSTKSWVNKLNRNNLNYTFELRNTPSGHKILIIEKPNLFSKSYRLKTKNYEEVIDTLEKKLMSLIKELGITVNQYDTLTKELGIDALGFTELALGTAEIKIRKFRDRMTLPEEASHVFVAMLNADYKKRLFTELKKSNYYKIILGEEYESYKEKYKNDEDALIFEAAGKLLAQVFINKELSIEQLPPTTRNLLQRIWDYLRILIGKFPIHLIEKELNILTEEIADRFLNNDITDIASIKNITPVGKNKDITKVLRITRSKIKSEK